MQIKHTVWNDSKDLKNIFQCLDNNVRFVGGCVRDSLLNISPKDLDLATTFEPKEVEIKLKQAGYKVIPTGIKYGTVTVFIKNKRYRTIEITSLRQDIKTDGRHAVVTYTKDWEQDAKRRDFTINALYADFDGLVYDYVHGIEDLFEKNVRFIGQAEHRIQEDYLRVLRYFRFFARYSNQAPDDRTIEIITKYKEQVAKISVDRVKQEFLKMFQLENSSVAFELMKKTGILDIYFPNADIDSLNRYLDISKKHDELLCLLALIPLNKDAILEFKKRWSLSQQKMKQMLYIQSFNLDKAPEEYNENDVFRFSVYFRNDSKREILSFLQAKYPNQNWLALNKPITSIKDNLFPVTGGDLLPFVKGKEIKENLDMLFEYWLSKNGSVSKKLLLEHFVKMRQGQSSRQSV